MSLEERVREGRHLVNTSPLFRPRYGVWPSMANNAVVMSKAYLGLLFGLENVPLVCGASERYGLCPL